MVLNHLGFGVEIETYVQPTYAPETRRGKAPRRIEKEHYQWFAGYLTNQYALPALGNNNSDHKYPHAYDRWWITFDRSLQTTETHIGMECVSPILKSSNDWQSDIGQFWNAIRASHTVVRNQRCGTHVHIAPRTRQFSIEEAKKIAFACCYYEPYIVSCLPTDRRDNKYCRRNSQVAVERMGALFQQRTSKSLGIIAEDIRNIQDFEALIQYMHGTLAANRRTVLWNFQNLVGDKGTIEFRGGRQMLGHHRTIRWINFVITFALMAIQENLLYNTDSLSVPRNSDIEEVQRFWNKLKEWAAYFGFDNELPPHFKQMSEIMH